MKPLCKKCGQEIPQTRRRGAKYCSILCRRGYHNKKWRDSNKEGVKDFARQYQRQYQQDNPEKTLLSRAKHRAKKKSLPFNLDLDDIVIPDVCPVLGVPLQRSNSSPSDNSPSLDKIIPELGYTKGNVIIISHRANRIKTNATLDEIKAVYEFYSKL